MSMFATPKTVDQGDELGKDDLIGALCVFQVTDYNPDTPTKYGSSPTLLAVVRVVDGPLAGRVENRFYCAGNLARQIGSALDVGQMCPGRIVTGSSANGRSWFGIDWATNPEDIKAAEQALRPTPQPATTLGDQARATTRDIRQQARQHTTDTAAPF